MDKVICWQFQKTSKEVIRPQKILKYMHGLKSAILAIFQKELGWPCPVSAVLKNASSFEKKNVLGADEYRERLEGKISKY